jgi:hypothetical protein
MTCAVLLRLVIRRREVRTHADDALEQQGEHDQDVQRSAAHGNAVYTRGAAAGSP